MLLAAFVLLSAAVLFGLFLAGTRPRGRGRFLHWPVVHGVLGAAGLAALALAWRRGGLHGPFAADALALIGAGLLAGLAIAGFAWRGRAAPMATILVHAALAGIGYLIVAGFAFG